MKKVLFDDQVEELCVMSARVLASYWMSCVCGPNGIDRVEKQGDILSVFWHLCLQLLFSNLHAVREEAVKCVTQMEDYTASQQHTDGPPAKSVCACTVYTISTQVYVVCIFIYNMLFSMMYILYFLFTI